MNFQLFCLISSALLVLVQANELKCDKDIAASFPKKCNELQSNLGSHHVSCEQCHKNLSAAAVGEIIGDKLNKVDELFENTLKIVQELKNEANIEIVKGPVGCYINSLKSPTVKYALKVFELCSSGGKYHDPSAESLAFISALGDVDFSKHENDENARKCICSFTVPLINTAYENYQTAINALEKCDIKKVFLEQHEREWVQCS